MTDYRLDGPIKTALDSATNDEPNIAYWRDDEDVYYITNEAHLNYLNNLGIYSIDVTNIINALQNLLINKEIVTKTELEEELGREVKFAELSNVHIESPVEEPELLVFTSEGKVMNKPKPDFQYSKNNILFATTGRGADEDEDEGEDDDDEDAHNNALTWNTIESMELRTTNNEVSDYRVTANMVASVSNNGRRMMFSIFVGAVEQEDITQEFRFDQGNDQKSITIIEYLKDVKPNTKITVRAKKGSGNSTTLSVFRRTLSIEQIN